MATIILPGCFDLFHDGHKALLSAASCLGINNQLIVCINSDKFAKKMKGEKWGEKYPIHHARERMHNIYVHLEGRVMTKIFDTEAELYEIIQNNCPCVIVKGPDYAWKKVTGDDIAPVLILSTPEPDSVTELKRSIYS